MCPRALIITDDTTQAQMSKLDQTIILETLSEIERRYKDKVRSCLNTVQTDPEKPILSKSMHHFSIGSGINTFTGSSSELEHTSLNVVRVEAWTSDSVAQLLRTGIVSLPTTLKFDELPEAFLQVVACTISHLTAIYMAHSAGVQYALVTEDGVVFPIDFKERLEHALRKAPSDWETLQMMVVNPRVANVVASLYATHHIKWYPTHNSSAAYIISREGMTKVLTRWGIKTNGWQFHAQPNFVWEFPADGVYHAHENIFFPTRSYTYSRAKLVDLPHRAIPLANGGARQTDTVSAWHHPSFRMLAPDSMIMISYMRVQHIDDFNRTIMSVLQNFLEVRKIVRLVTYK